MTPHLTPLTMSSLIELTDRLELSMHDSPDWDSLVRGILRNGFCLTSF
jgi:hypothetical protein